MASRSSFRALRFFSYGEAQNTLLRGFASLHVDTNCILSSTFLPHRPHLRGPENERETSFKDELISRATELVKAHGNTSPWCMANDGRGWLCLLFDEEEEKLLARCAQRYCRKFSHVPARLLWD
jgi:hypothetical protein